jgi:hypothetical protein
MKVPERFHWLFWDLAPDALDVEKNSRTIIARILEHGNAHAVRWTIEAYGLDRLRTFFEHGGHPELSPRTIAFWAAALGSRGWSEGTKWRRTSNAPWIW